jgi:hypothetical protein
MPNTVFLVLEKIYDDVGNYIADETLSVCATEAAARKKIAGDILLPEMFDTGYVHIKEVAVEGTPDA